MELQPISDAEMFFWRAWPVVVRVYFWLLFTFGLGFCVWTFRKTGRKGYLLIALYFLSPFVGLGVGALSRQIHEEESRREIEQKQARGEPIALQTTVSFPLFETCLLVGLLLLSRGQDKRANQRAEATPLEPSENRETRSQPFARPGAPHA